MCMFEKIAVTLCGESNNFKKYSVLRLDRIIVI